MEMLVVQSKIRDEIKKRDANMASDFCEALTKEVSGIIDRAVKRAHANGRKTVRASDL